MPPIWQTAPDLGSAEEGSEIDIKLSARSLNEIADASLVYTVVGTMPHGWFLSTNGSVAGIAPLVVNDDFETSFTVRVDDGVLTSDQTFTLVIARNQDRLPPAEPRWITPEGFIGEVI